jgi:hypothetical protein
MTPKPPDILRKSHRHTDRKERATAKENLRAAAADAVEELDEHPADRNEERLSRRKKRSTTANVPGTTLPDDRAD